MPSSFQAGSAGSRFGGVAGCAASSALGKAAPGSGTRLQEMFLSVHSSWTFSKMS